MLVYDPRHPESTPRSPIDSNDNEEITLNRIHTTPRHSSSLCLRNCENISSSIFFSLRELTLPLGPMWRLLYFANRHAYSSLAQCTIPGRRKEGKVCTVYDSLVLTNIYSCTLEASLPFDSAWNSKEHSSCASWLNSLLHRRQQI